MSIDRAVSPAAVRFAVATACLSGALIATGCGDSSSDSAAGSGGSKDSGSKVALPAARGDIASFSWNLPSGEPVTLDPAGSNSVSAATVTPNVCESLLRYHPDNSVTSGLATKVDTPTPRTWVYTIRKGVRFSDGKPMTAEDVEYSLARNLNPKVGTFGTAYQDVESVKQTGKWEVTVTMRRPSTLFNVFASTGAAGISEKAFVERVGSKYGTPSTGVMCTGPFEFGGWKPGDSMTLKRNPTYWDASNKARAGSVRFSFITETNTYINALRSGDADGSFGLSPTNAQALDSATNGATYTGPSFNWAALVPHRRDGLMGNVKIRRALSLVIPRDGIAAKIYGGTATPLYWLGPDSALRAPAVPEAAAATYKAAYATTPRLDVAQAKKLVQEAGSPKAPISIAVFPGDDIGRKTGTIIQQAAKQVGLNVQIRPSPGPQIEQGFSDPKVLPDIDLLWARDAYRAPSALTNAPYYVGPKASSNLIGYENPEVDAQLEKAVAATDPADAAGPLASVLGTMARDQVAIPLVSNQNVVFVNKRLGGVPLSHPFYENGAWAASIGTP